MPGKYSHSVVLADYSSRGIISLSNEQHLAYLTSSPYSASTYGRSSSKAPSRGTHTSNSNSRNTSSKSGHYDGPSPRTSSASRYIVIDPTTVHGNNDRRPSNQPSVPSLRCKSVEPTSFSRRVKEHIEREDVGSKYRPGTSMGVASSVRPVEAHINVCEYSQRLNSTPSWTTTHPATGTHVKPPRLTREKSLDRAPLQTKSETQSVAAPIASTSRASSGSAYGIVRSTDETHRQFSSSTTGAQSYRPLSPAVELDFEGFSDSEETNSPYFEPPPIPRGLGAPDAGAGMLNSLRKQEISSPRLVSQSRQSHTRSLYSPLSAPSDRFLATSPNNDHQGPLNSLTSQSSLGSWGTPSISHGSKQLESSKVTILPQASIERLPEIIEDNHFGPDLFAQSLDDVKPSSHLAMEGYGERSLGMVSSGKDVMFDIESDNQSLTGAACPPDIGRSREDDTSDAMQFLQKVKSQDGRYSSTRGSPLHSKKSKTLFSRFRLTH